jgi:ribonuclease P/MRP protein subunit POP3
VGLNSITRHLEALAATNAPSTISKSKKPPTFESEKDQSTSQPKCSADLAACKEQDASPATQSTNTSTKPVSTLAQVPILILPTPTPQTSLAHSHFPTLLYLSSPASTADPKTSTPSAHKDSSASHFTTSAQAPRLILLPPSSENRLATALGIPRVGALAILDNAPGANTLIEYCREKVGTMECAWVEEGMRAEWNGVKGSF